MRSLLSPSDPPSKWPKAPSCNVAGPAGGYSQVPALGHQKRGHTPETAHEASLAVTAATADLGMLEGCADPWGWEKGFPSQHGKQAGPLHIAAYTGCGM